MMPKKLAGMDREAADACGAWLGIMNEACLVNSNLLALISGHAKALHRVSRKWLKILWLHTGLFCGFDCFLQSRPDPILIMTSKRARPRDAIA